MKKVLAVVCFLATSCSQLFASNGFSHALSSDLALLSGQLASLNQALVSVQPQEQSKIEALAALRSMTVLSKSGAEDSAIEEYAIAAYQLINKFIQDPTVVDPAQQLKKQSAELVTSLPTETRAAIDRMMTLLLSESALDWCDCFPVRSRILMVIKLLRDIEKNYPDKTKQLVYTTLGSGDLLQDYLILSELIHAGYINIGVNIIDANYPDLTLKEKELAAEEKSIEAAEVEPAIVEESDPVKMIERFTELLEQALFAREMELINKKLEGASPRERTRLLKQPLSSKLSVHHFDDPYQYMALAQRGNFPKTDVLTRVDAPGMYSLSHEYITAANALELENLRIFFPRCSPAAVYGLPEALTSPFGQCVLNKLKTLGRKVHARSALIELIESCKLEVGLSEQTMDWIGDATISFHDLVCFATHSSTVTYMLDYKDRLYADEKAMAANRESTSSDEENGEPEDLATSELVDLLKIDSSRYKKINIVQVIAESELIPEGFKLLYELPIA